MWKALVFILLFASSNLEMAVAQDIPIVEVVLDQTTASQGNLVDAHVSIKGAVNVAGVDIGLKVDESCLRITERQNGDFLPLDEGVTFTSLNELNDHDTRLAVALTDRTRHASGDGIFFTVQLEVLCSDALAVIEVTRAQLSAYEDPEAPIVTIVPYRVSLDNVRVINAELAISPATQATVPAATAEATVAPTAPSAPTVAPQSNSIVLIVLVVLMILIGGVLYLLVRTMRRR